MTSSIAQSLSPAQLAMLQRIADIVPAVKPLSSQSQPQTPQPTVAPPSGSGRGRLVDIVV